MIEHQMQRPHSVLSSCDVDNDNDHLINFDDTNDDIDVWYTAWEVEWGMDPFDDDLKPSTSTMTA